MNCARARCSRASIADITTKRAPEIRPGRLEVHAESLAERDVILGLEVELARHAPAAHLDIGRLIESVRDAGIQHVRQAHLQIRRFATERASSLLSTPCSSVPKDSPAASRAGNILALRLGESDRLRVGIALGAQPIRFDLRGSCAALPERGKRLHVEHEATPRQCGGNTG